MRLDSKGPIIYRQVRVGHRGKCFDVMKFRSMRVDAEAGTGAQWASENDPRVTRVGRFLRKYRLDELPQFFNVIRGEMSVVGPRMIPAPELEKYGEFRDLLLTVRPGITGFWQVYGRQEVSYEERVRMDVRYIREWTLRMDLKLLCLTPWRVVRGRGAY